MSTDDVLQTFVAEARELLLGMEDSLLALERDPRDGEAISATFRAIHTIKGSAGLFSRVSAASTSALQISCTG